MNMLNRRALLAIACGWVAGSGRAHAQVGNVLERSRVRCVTHHTGRFNGSRIAYTATVAGCLAPNPGGGSAGAIVTTAYVRDAASMSASARPVLFLFNGGPGASSTPLHFSGVGPKRRRTPPGASLAILEDNPHCPLDFVDLVFIDPIGTGFSRPADDASGHGFWSMEGDAESVMTYVETWLKDNGRQASPAFLCGESYGTARACMMLRSRAKPRFAGLVLISSWINASAMAIEPGNDLAPIFWLPSMAMVAAFHGRADGSGSLSDQYRRAQTFAEGPYAAALLQGDALQDVEADSVARQMSALIGLAPAALRAHGLRPTPEQFWNGLLADKGLRTGRLDGRATGPLHAPNLPPPYDDPGLRGGDSKKALADYFRDSLGVREVGDYVALNGAVGDEWVMTYGDVAERGYDDVSQYLGEAMRRSPFPLLMVGGYYDLATPVLAGRHAITHTGAPLDRVRFRAYAAGHSILDETAVLEDFVADLRRMISAP
jgi:carboxypeptidase C (cathepsin A)